jgi:signal recognition particle subunit SRP54
MAGIANMLGLGSGMPSPEQMAKLAEKMPGGLPPGGLPPGGPPPGMPGAPGLPPTVPGLPPKFPGLGAPKLPGLGGYPGPGKKR